MAGSQLLFRKTVTRKLILVEDDGTLLLAENIFIKALAALRTRFSAKCPTTATYSFYWKVLRRNPLRAYPLRAASYAASVASLACL